MNGDKWNLAVKLLCEAQDKKYFIIYKNIYISAVISVVALLVIWPYVKE
jgi:hypothetical protein